MPNFNIQIKGLDEFIKDNKRAADNIPTLVGKALMESTGRIKDDARNAITEQGISNTGNLRRSINNWLEGMWKGIVGVGERYGAYVEFGTKPHFPPVAPLERWAQTKLGTSGLGFVIARKIARKGTKAQAYLGPSLEKNLDFVVERFSQMGLTVVKMMGGR